MQIYRRTLGNTIKNVQSDFLTNKLYFLHRANHLCSHMNPVKMAFEVFEPELSDPNASPLMIMHGLFGSKQNWRGRSKIIGNETKLKIYNVDARNHGNSPHVPEHNTKCIADDIALLMQEQNLKKISLMGYSMGGMAMMYFALKYPELVDKMIIIDISPISIPENKFKFIDDIFIAIKNMNVSPDLSMADGRVVAECHLKEMIQDKALIDTILLNLRKSKSGEFVWVPNVAALHANFPYSQPQEFNMPPFDGPVLFIGAERSGYINPADWPKIKKLFPHAQLEWLDAGHLVHFDQPVKFIELVSNFLKS